ncbi:MAG: hypothetical protein HZA04_00505 [Nitrospinae bacterium]|nr:hypothetical protein [Nitrospinota bacterium]
MADRFDAAGHWVKPPLGPEAFVLAAETGAILRQCLDTLTLSQRAAFVLKEVEGEASTDICNILEVSVSNLGVLLYRARNRLRECIESKYAEQK